MARMATISVARQVGALFAGGSAAGLSDRELLERVVEGPETHEAAFAAIVARHGPMVLGVCRQLLGDHHDAEDAFQAVFLVLARKARSIRDPNGLGAWLYGVALRTARKARRRRDRLRKAEEAQQANAAYSGRMPGQPEAALLDRERAEALHREIDRLPGNYRMPVVLCYFEGLTLDEAAHRLRWPVGTLRSRIARARNRLRLALDRRGFALSSAAIAVMLGSARAARASVSPLLCESTTRAALRFAARQSAAVGASASAASAMAQEVLRTMVFARIRMVISSLLMVAAAAMAGATWIVRPEAMADEPRIRPAVRTTVDEPTAPRMPARERMTVVGRVLDPQGRPVAKAVVTVLGASKQADDRPMAGEPEVLGQATCDASGRFRLEMPRITSATHHMIGVTAMAPGYGMGWVDLGVDAEQPSAEVTLRPEQVVVGRIFDIKGRVVPGVKLTVEGVGHTKVGPEVLPDHIEGPHFLGGGTSPPAAWPAPVVTDNEGRFTIRGIGQGLRTLLMADDPEYARQRIIVDTDDAPESKPVRVALQPAKVFTGRITYADTGKPVPHALIEIYAYIGGPGYTSRHEADDQGNYRANPMAADRYAILVYAPEGQPYMNASAGGNRPFTWPKAAQEKRIDLALRRGALIRGKIVEEGTNRPVEGAALRFSRPNEGADDPTSWTGTARSGPDGSYQIAVKPGRGTLVVLGPSDDYVLRQIGQKELNEGKRGGQRVYAHALVPCEIKHGDASRQMDIVLRRGTTVKARVIGPDGEPVASAWAFSSAILMPQPWPSRRFWGEFCGQVHDGFFELHGVPPEGEVPVYFLDGKNQTGGVAMFSAAAAKDGPMMVRLQPCGMAMARLVDGKGKPVAGYRNPWMLSMLVTPDVEMSEIVSPGDDALRPDGDYVSRLDREHHGELISDPQGRITFPSLIPGARFRLQDPTSADDPGKRRVRKWFIAAPGQAIELGDIVIEKPERE